MPGCNAGLAATPVVGGKAEVEIGEGTADRDMADGKWGAGERLSLLVQRQQRHSAALRIACQVDLRGMLALLLVPPQQQKIEKAVAERLPAQSGHPFRKRGWKELRLVVQAVEIFADHWRIKDDGAVVEHERRDLGERVVFHQLGVWLGRGRHGAYAVDAVDEAELVRRDHDL